MYFFLYIMPITVCMFMHYFVFQAQGTLAVRFVHLIILFYSAYNFGLLKEINPGKNNSILQAPWVHMLHSNVH